MPQDLPGLAHELRKETCPRRVIDETERRIAAETSRPSRFRFVIPVALAASVLVCGLLLVRSWRAGGKASSGRQPELVAQQAHGRVQAARDTETALGLIGTVLLDAGVHSQTVISDRAIPPLRNGFQTAKNKIMRQNEL